MVVVLCSSVRCNGRNVRNPACEIIEPGVIKHNEGEKFSLGEPDGIRTDNNHNPYGMDQDSSHNHPISYNMPKDSPSCLSFAEHHANCPICSKFYNNDKTLYVVIIIILSLICILLLKRVLNL